MEQTQIYEGTPEQLINELKQLPETRKYRVTVIPQELDLGDKTGRMIVFGMFPQLQTLTDEDFKAAEWRGEDVEL